ncbi:MAG: ABC transporter permease [Vicinamibacterales bacterium]
MPRWREIVTLYAWEVRSALRERSIIVNSIVIPIVLYPAILWLTFTGVAFVRGQTDDLASRLAIPGLVDVPGGPALRDRLAETDGIVLEDDLTAGPAADALAAGRVDAVLEATPGGGAGTPRLTLRYDGARERSSAARRRVSAAVETARAVTVRATAGAHGLDAGAWAAFAVDEQNTATSEQMGAQVLGLMLPLFFVVMVAIGCFYPAIDTTAGERERHTWETLMTTAASRTSVTAAKFLHVATFGGLAGLLNVTAMTLTMRGVLTPLTGDTTGVDFSVPWSALPVLAVAALLLASFIAAGMMVFASFARTFREGQTLITPFYLAVLLPTVFLGSRGAEFTMRLAAVPVINIALVTRDAFAGVFRAPQMAMTAVVTLAAVAALVKLATLITEAEDVGLGSFAGGLPAFVRTRVLGAGRGRRR